MLGDNPSFTFSFILLFLNSWSCFLCSNFIVFFSFGFLCQVYPLMHWKCEVLFCCPETDFCPSLFKNPKISEFYIFLKLLDSKPDTFIYLSLVFTFWIWVTEVPRKTRSFTDRSDFDRFCFYFAFVSLPLSHVIL